MLVTCDKIGEVHIRILATNGCHVKAKNERFNAMSSFCRQDLKSCRRLADYYGRPNVSIFAKFHSLSLKLIRCR